ncbi:MAG: hypothetical protein INR73_18710 [Williamsia sp.]|nr:hypothetical protein [Williamsia sp.]
MKKVFFLAVASISLLATSCKKEVVKVPESKIEVPDELVGKWQIGNFSISNFSSYNGTRPANVTSTIAYKISLDGTAEQYIYVDANDGSDLQTLTYRKGTIVVNPNSKTWKFCPASGTFQKFQNGKKTTGNINSDGLYPKYAPAYSSYYLEQYNQTNYLGCTNEYSEDMLFKNTNW